MNTTKLFYIKTKCKEFYAECDSYKEALDTIEQYISELIAKRPHAEETIRSDYSIKSIALFGADVLKPTTKTITIEI